MNCVISALAEAFWPSLPLLVDRDDTRSRDQQRASPQAAYNQLSGADCPQVTQAALDVINKQLYGPNQTKLRLVLQLMSYRLPMLLLAGRHCLSPHWPFVLSLPEMPVAQRQSMLASWVHSPLPDLKAAYKALKAILSASLLSHIDPATNTNPFFARLGYVPGNALKDSTAGAGPAHPMAAEQEEVLASATIHLPGVLAATGSAAAAQAYLSKRGFSTLSADQHIISSSGSIHLCYDAVIVGSGAGGGVTAAVLAAAGLKVLVLEKSSWVRSTDMTWLENEAFEAMYERAGFLATDDGALVMLAGSTLGGGTKINWTASIRPPPHVRQEWASAPHGLTHLGADSPVFEQALDTVCARLGVCKGTTLSTPNAKLQEGLKGLGQHVEEYPRNCLSKTCSAYCNMGCRSGHKQSSEVWLVDAVRAGAQVLTGVQAQRVLTRQQQQAGSVKAQRAVGVEALVSSSSRSSDTQQSSSAAIRLVVHAPIVISSCGSINTPALLLRSGITGGGSVGSNLRLHPATGIVSMFRPTPEQAAAGEGSVQMHKGVSMAVYSTAAANWTAGGYGAFISVPAVQPGLLGAISPDTSPGYMKQLMAEVPDASLVVVFTRDTGSGRVSIDREGRPVISYWPCPTTRKHLMEGIITSVRAMAAAGAERIVVPNAAEAWDLRLDPAAPADVRQQQIEAFCARMREVGVVKYDLPLFSAHQMGSCRMGASPRSSACDPAGELWDVAGLYVADGSAFPTPSGVNPMISIYAISYLTAQGIALRWRAQQKKNC